MNSYALFVQDGELTGILTRSDLVNATILERQPIHDPVGPLRAIRSFASGRTISSRLRYCG